MSSDSQDFSLSGPLHLPKIDWTNEDHRRSVAACLVQGVYVAEHDRNQKREGSQALASHWWEFFNFEMLYQLEDDSSIFGAVYKFETPASHSNQSTNGCPRYVIAFRGTIIKPIKRIKLKSLTQDLRLNLQIIRNKLHSSSRFKIACEAVGSLVDSIGSSNNVWLAGHSLGSAIALNVGKTMAESGILLESFLFNPPFPSAPIERIKDKKVKRVIRFGVSTVTAGLALVTEKKSGDPFLALSAWVPYLFVNPADCICSEYVGYFEHKKEMEEFGVGGMERLANQLSLRGLATGKVSEPMHRIPSAKLTVNLTPKQAHGIQQWWGQNVHLESVFYTT